MAFYGSEDFLVSSVRDFLRPAWREGGTVLVVATPAHRRRYVAAFAEDGVDVPAAEREGRLRLLDADDTLATFMVDGAPDRERCRQVLGPVLEDATRGGGRVRICGEMVALLWERGDVAGAIALEDVWNEFGAEHPLAIFCPYPLGVFAAEGQDEAFRTVCGLHTHVVPAESFAEDATPAEQRLQVADLQRAAAATRRDHGRLLREHAALQAEVEHLREQDHLRTQFVAMVAHDLQSPMAVLRGLLGLLQDTWGELDGPEVEEFLDRSLRSAGRLERLVRDVLTVARLEGGEFAFDIGPIDLEALVREVAADLAAASGRVVDVRVAGPLPAAWADGDRQRQILSNLLSNAAKFSADLEAVTVTVVPGDGHLAVAVRDHGVGIAEDALTSLFRPFVRGTSRRPTEGTGLGLYITRALVEGQGGTIEVASTPGEGSVFTYTVPQAGQAQPG